MSHDALDCKLAIPAVVKAGAAGSPTGSPANPLAIPLKFTLQNRGKVSLRVLNWNTPLEGFFGNYLLVTGPDGPVPYEGPMVKRGAPERDEYVVIAPGQKVEADVDLALPYRIVKPGRYKVSYVGSLFDVTTAAIPRKLEQFSAMKLHCEAMEFELQTSPPRR